MFVLTGSLCNVSCVRIHAANIFHISMTSILNLAVPHLTLLQLTSSKVSGASQHQPTILSVQHLNNYIPITISNHAFEWDLLFELLP